MSDHFEFALAILCDWIGISRQDCAALLEAAALAQPEDWSKLPTLYKSDTAV